jgi:hypothetical protein
MSWITFILIGQSPSKKTERWRVVPNDHPGSTIGFILWYGPWRKYTFQPAGQCVFEQDCLREISDFIEARTREHKAKKCNLCGGTGWYESSHEEMDGIVTQGRACPRCKKQGAKA